MIAPEPFFEPRGTPFSEYHRIRALTELGHQVDLVTYPFGQDVAIWEHKVWRDRPTLCDGDGAIGALRRWYRQFYPALQEDVTT